ncbi:MAG: hypothetical protein GY926_19225 [bacterium]|nr:hypothetical protein [bacterium]
MRVIPHRRVPYYLIVFSCGVVAHQGVVSSIFGAEAADLLRRNSEAYAMMWLPLYWDLFAATADPDGLGDTASVGSQRHLRLQLAWFTLLAVVGMVLTTSAAGSTDGSIPTSVVTLGEAFIAGFAVTLYLGWSRRIYPGPTHNILGLAMVPATRRTGYYALVALIAIASEQSGLADLVGDGVSEWLQINTEAYAAMLLIAVYFDLVAASPNRSIRLAWYSWLGAAPILVQTGLVDGMLPESVVAWLGTTTEAFIAAFVISVYFDVIRGRVSGHGHGSAASEATDRFVQESG